MGSGLGKWSAAVKRLRPVELDAAPSLGRQRNARRQRRDFPGGWAGLLGVGTAWGLPAD